MGCFFIWHLIILGFVWNMDFSGFPSFIYIELKCYFRCITNWLCFFLYIENLLFLFFRCILSKSVDDQISYLLRIILNMYELSNLPREGLHIILAYRWISLKSALSIHFHFSYTFAFWDCFAVQIGLFKKCRHCFFKIIVFSLYIFMGWVPQFSYHCKDSAWIYE